MGQDYDITSHELIEISPEGWLAYLGVPRDPQLVRVIEADLKTVSAEVDKVIRVEDPQPWLLHLEFQTRSENRLPRRIMGYNAMLQSRHLLPVASVAVLLRKEAHAANITGEYHTQTPLGSNGVFRYHVLRLWLEPPEALLQASLGLAALAPLANVPEQQIPLIIDRLRTRFQREASLDDQGRLWTAVHIMMGLKYSQEFTELMLQGVVGMEDSVTYQAIVRSAAERALRIGIQQGVQLGRQEGLEQGLSRGSRDEALRVLRRLGTRKLGPIPPEVDARLEAITDPEQLDSLIDRVLVISSWHELLKHPSSSENSP